MGPLKSPSLDGYNASFFQNYWHIVGSDVTVAALKFLIEGHMDNGINYIFLVLIPKTLNPAPPSDYRPISVYVM